MALGAQIIDLIRLNLLNYTNQISAICKITVMKKQPWR